MSDNEIQSGHNDDSHNDDSHNDDGDCPADCELGPLQGEERAKEALSIRHRAAQEQFNRNFEPDAAPQHPCNDDEEIYAQQNAQNKFVFIGNYSKGLPHDDQTGEVRRDAYCALLRALNDGSSNLFEILPLGCPPSQRLLENPQAAYAFDLQGADSHSLGMPAPPAFSSEEEVADILENYWMALSRDIPFIDYSGSQAPVSAVLDATFADLKRFDFYIPGSPFFFRTELRRQTLFRGFSSGDAIGPYVSQFLLMDVPYGAQVIPARIATVLPGIDYLTAWDEWLGVQNGCDASQTGCDPVRRFIRSGRDLGQFVHVDRDINAFWNAAWILFSGGEPLRRCEAAAGLGVEFAENLPYINPSAPCNTQFPTKSRTQIGVATFGPQHVLSLLLEAEARALRAVWYQKWLVHRRLRPEEFGGRIDAYLNKRASFPIHSSLDKSLLFGIGGNFNPTAGEFGIYGYNRLQNCNNRRSGQTDGTYLLPMAFAKGSPLHPSYGAGHGTVAGACATILKAFFVEEQCFLSPAQANREGTSLVPYTGRDRDQITVRGELDKLASNISLGRNFAGVHWRSDHTQSLLLGERVAIALLFDQRALFNEDFKWQFHRFDGSKVVIDKNSTVADLRGWLL